MSRKYSKLADFLIAKTLTKPHLYGAIVLSLYWPRDATTYHLRCETIGKFVLPAWFVKGCTKETIESLT